jgi:hypothetical protein
MIVSGKELSFLALDHSCNDYSYLAECNIFNSHSWLVTGPGRIQTQKPFCRLRHLEGSSWVMLYSMLYNRGVLYHIFVTIVCYITRSTKCCNDMLCKRIMYVP